jgi:hypothetical protein
MRVARLCCVRMLPSVNQQEPLSAIVSSRMRKLGIAALLLVACHRQLPSGAAAAAAEHEESALALRDLKADLASAQAAFARAGDALYACDRLAVAVKHLGDATDEPTQHLLLDADLLCAVKAPLALADAKLKEDTPDCARVTELLGRVGAKHKTDAAVVELVKRYKSVCRGRGLRASSAGGGGADRGAQHDGCRRRCGDAAFDCRSRCQYCGSCTNDKTWEWCNSVCNTCKQGCEQNERFCQSSCG